MVQLPQNCTRVQRSSTKLLSTTDNTTGGGEDRQEICHLNTNGVTIQQLSERFQERSLLIIEQHCPAAFYCHVLEAATTWWTVSVLTQLHPQTSTDTQKHEVSIKMQRENNNNNNNNNNMRGSTKANIHMLNMEIYVIIGFLMLSLMHAWHDPLEKNLTDAAELVIFLFIKW